MADKNFNSIDELMNYVYDQVEQVIYWTNTILKD